MILHHKTNIKPTVLDNIMVIAEGSKWQEFSDTELAKMNDSLCFRYRIQTTVYKTSKLARFAQTWKDNFGLQWLCANDKTGDSVDVTTNCMFNCSYCYCNNPYIKSRIQPWSIDDLYLTPTRQEAFRNYLIARKQLVKNHPLRFGSLADFPNSMLGTILKLLEICKDTNTRTIFVTKNKDIIPIVYDLASVTLYSVDHGIYNAPSNIGKYVSLQREYPNLRMFGMVVDFSELRWFYRRIDSYRIPLENIQFVSYHGQIIKTEKNKPGVQSQLTNLLKPEMLQLLTGRACCVNGRCLSCTLLCGLGKTINKFTFKPYKHIIKKGGD